MGFFGTYQFNGSAWSEGDPAAGPSGPEPWLWVDIYDSDFTTIRYAPVGSGTGVAFLNSTPRVYFESDDASTPTHVGRESLGLAEWWASHTPGASGPEQDSKRAEIAALLASDDVTSDDASEDDADIFAEIKTVRLLTTLGIPVPEDMAEDDA